MKPNKKTLGLTKAIILSVIITTSVALLMLTVIGFCVSYSKVMYGVFSTTEQSLAVYSEEVNQWLTRQAEFTAAQANAAGKLAEISGGHQNNDDFIDSEIQELLQHIEKPPILKTESEVYAAQCSPSQFSFFKRGIRIYKEPMNCDFSHSSALHLCVWLFDNCNF